MQKKAKKSNLEEPISAIKEEVFVVTSEYEAAPPQFLSIKEWRKDERPRERFARLGGAALSDAELLAINIKTGTKDRTALDIGKDLLRLYGSISGIASRDVSELRKIHGLGEVKSITLLAALELAKRVESEPFSAKKIIRSPEDVAKIYIPKLRGERKEYFYALLLNSANQVFRDVVVSEGSLNASLAHPREFFRLAVTESAASVIALHNHPSGNTEPSKEDISITKQLSEAGKILGIPLHDHIIIAGETYTSLADRNLM